MRARTPDALKDLDRPLDECVAACFPHSHALLEGARHSLFYSLPVAFDPAAGEGCYLATVDRDEQGQPWRFLDKPELLPRFLAAEKERLGAETLKRAQRVAAVIIEPIQGEGGVRMASARFFRRLRLLTLIHETPLIFDEVQTGFGATGAMWAHEHFTLPAPPDAVTWAKKGQNGVLFVNEALAAFFQEEKKFNTYYLLAMAIHPSVGNAGEMEHHLLELLGARVIAHGYLYFASLVEERFKTSGPPWLRSAEVVRVMGNYLRSGARFVYLHTALGPEAGDSNPVMHQ